ncbi:hypothetical protein ACJ8CM_20200 [Klebsiella pneumoniae]
MFKNGFFGPMNAKTQEGMGMSDLPKNIQVIFDNNPMLKELIPNPVLASGSSFIVAFNDKLALSTKNSEKDDIYKVVFKKDSSRDLMAINSGELKGLLTTTCIEKGKISDVAGLEKIEIDNKNELMPTLLGISLYSSIQASLSYISQLFTDIRNHQIIEEQARFERISETIVDSFRSIPDISLDRSMRDVYLTRIVKNNDDCFELYASQRIQFAKLLQSEPEYYSTGYNHYYNSNNGQRFYPDRFFINNVLTHPVFAVFERLVAGRICEIVISGNFSDSNIQRHKDFIYRIQTKLEELMKYRLCAFERFTMEQKNIIDEDLNLTGHDRKELEKNLMNTLISLKKLMRKYFHY